MTTSTIEVGVRVTMGPSIGLGVLPPRSEWPPRDAIEILDPLGSRDERARLPPRAVGSLTDPSVLADLSLL